jgi:hypothetical protein
VDRRLSPRTKRAAVLEATSTLVAATSILNVWANDPAETAAADAALHASRAGHARDR